MKYYVQFLTLSSGVKYDNGKMVDVDKFPIEAMGSDSVFILDARNNLETMKFDAVKRMEQLKRVQDYIGFKIMKGDRFTNSKQVYNSIK